MRFLYLADTHVGLEAKGYRQQPNYPARLPEILAALRGWMRGQSPVDFILHGGDMADAGTPQNIDRAVELFAFPVPVFLCLGNHDLKGPDALREWLARAPAFFPGGAPEFILRDPHAALAVLPNHWEERPYTWETTQAPRFAPDQLALARAAWAACPDAAHLLCTHCPTFGLPPGQTGMPEPYHAPADDFTRAVLDLTSPPGSVSLVLGAHNHMNSCLRRDGTAFVTASALIETPFEFKLIEITAGHLRLRTFALRDRLGFVAEYDDTRPYAQGRREDREWGA